MMSSTTSFKPRRFKTTEKPPRRINNKEPSPAKQPVLKCPRCDSLNTKFCYYNNYSLSQPRHYCKNCRRYWTRGGSLRNVPIGGSTRNKNRSAILNPNLSSYMSSLDPNNHNIASSSIESLSSLINQDLQKKLQEQRLITSMFLQDSLPVTEKSVMFQNVELIPPSTASIGGGGGGGGAPSGSIENIGDSEGSLRNWYHYNAYDTSLL